MRICLTGVTGLLGSNFLAECIKRNLDSLDNLELIILGRMRGQVPLKKRIMQTILGRDGLAYLQVSDSQKGFLELFLERQVVYLDYTLEDERCGVSAESLRLLRQKHVDFFFHIASLTDFRSSTNVQIALNQVNCIGTRNILQLLDDMSVGEFVYVGSAYSCGLAQGIILPNHVNFSAKFRNPYEKTKLMAEEYVREYCATKKLRLRVFRPSTICGRLMEEPFGSVTKFDVFYSWVAWFMRLKMKAGIHLDKIYETPLDLPVRIACREDAGLNIVPADFAAKAMYKITIGRASCDSCYLVNDAETPHRDYVSWMIEFLNIKGTTFVNKVPEDARNDYELFYYKTIGQIFTPYVISEPMLFDTSNISSELSRDGLLCPRIDKTNFFKLLSFAKEASFGLKSSCK
ncbi:MAG: NAD-dependent epimerase/dehydratase family protein [Candidatus Omnitrophica bacterium]|nr:NAD-dependent epimerase/dehydratase family protein [Candidatus Omnitrophota bacterium]